MRTLGKGPISEKIKSARQDLEQALEELERLPYVSPILTKHGQPRTP